MKKTPRPLIVSGLLLSAVIWVALVAAAMSFLGATSAVATGNAPPVDDGSVLAKITALDRGKDFEISLSTRITDRSGDPLGGLDQEDIEVYENGQLVDTDNFLPAGKGAIRLCLVVDYSISMGDGTPRINSRASNKIIEARKAARALIRMLRDKDDWVGLYFFNDSHFDNNRSERLPIGPLDHIRREDAWDALMFTGTGEGSPMTGTIDRALTSMESVPGRRVIIVLTDGMDTGEPAEVARAREKMLARSRELKVPLYMVTTSKENADKETMKEMASATGGEFHDVPKPEQLKEIFETIGRSLQDEYTFTYKSPNPVEDGRKRNVAVVVRNKSVGTTSEGSYNVPGVIATGADTPKSDNAGSASLFTVFLSLAGLLGVFLAVPFVFRPRGSSAPVVQPAVAAVPVKQPAAVDPVASAAPVKQARPAGSSSSRPRAKLAATPDAAPPGGTSQPRQRHR
ncbi:MAG: VWA domain-containing protein [Gemmataceae bacterium]